MSEITTVLPVFYPFIPAGFPQNLIPSNVSFNGVNNNYTTGIEEPENLCVTIFPNPVTEILNITLPGKQKTQVQIYNAEGMLLKEISITQSDKVSTADLDGGLYFICLKNNPHLFQKFIKQ